jgi:hypothetical protein
VCPYLVFHNNILRFTIKQDNMIASDGDDISDDETSSRHLQLHEACLQAQESPAVRAVRIFLKQDAAQKLRLREKRRVRTSKKSNLAIYINIITEPGKLKSSLTPNLF